MNEKVKKLHILLKSNQEKNKKRVDLLIEIAWNLWILDVNTSTEYSKEALQLAQDLKYPKGIAYAKRNLGMLYFSQTDLDKSMNCFIEAKKWFEDNDDKDGQAFTNLGIGLLYWNFGDFDIGFSHTNEALDLFKDSENLEGQAWTYNSFGNYYFDWKDYKQSLHYFQKSYDLFEQTDHEMGKARSLNGMGNIYNYQGDYDKALEYQIKSLEIHRNVGNVFGESRTLNDIGLIHQNLGKYNRALEYHTKSLNQRKEMKYAPGITTNLLDIGDVYFHQKKYEEAIKNINEALKLSEKINAKLKICRAHYSLYNIFKEQGDTSKALEHHEVFHKFEDEIYHEDSEKRLENLKNAFKIEASLKEAEINRLKNIELKEKNEKLKRTLNELNATQAQLLQTGKVVALGNLVSGILHEINTPTASIKGAVDNSLRAIEKLTKLFESICTGEQTDLRNEFDKLLGAIFKNIQISTEASDRILTIVQSLKNFSRLDEANFQLVDIHEGIDNTLMLLGSELTDRIQVEKSYGDIPKIFCYPNELNQVFMNLLMNATHAIEGIGTISINTQEESNQILIKISDSGKGIPLKKVEKLFEPGFTRSDSRIRMRTGLYSSYNIIHKHKGKLSVESDLGKGSTFTISIPLSVNGIQTQSA